MELLKIIKENKNWEEILSNKPYSLSIKKDERYILFSYSMIESDFSLEAVCEARGITFRRLDWKCVSRRFDKFFNTQEPHASEIDWSSAKVQEKLDGSLIALWFDDNEWHVSTNGTIDAFQASLQNDLSSYKTFGDLFVSVFPQELFYNTLETNKTYIFELTSPYNRVVVPYQKTEIWHIGTRDNDTFEESDDDIGIQKPKRYNISSLNECLQIAERLPFSEEGYVVVDSFWNRIKIKSAAYVAAHHLKNNGVITKPRIVDMLRVGGQDDFLSIYPEYSESFDFITESISNFFGKIISDMENLPSLSVDRKSFAQWAVRSANPSFFFLLYDGKVEGSYDGLNKWFWSQNSEKILKMIGEE